MRVGILDLLALLFVILKLTGAIDWSWFWVMFPLIIELVILILALLLVAVAKSSEKRR